MKTDVNYFNIFIIILVSLLLYSASIYVIMEASETSTRPIYSFEKLVIIDTDAGADDAVAILLTLMSEETGFKVIAITCTYGNTYLENVTTNVQKILTMANRTDIIVYKGAEKSLIMNYNSTNYFGIDGFGDFDFTENITATVDESKHAAVALVDLAKQYPGQITLLSIGPSTNVAIAIALEPSFLKYLKNHVIVGASVSGIGNLRPNVEFNFGHDPEANYMILEKTAERVLFPWETMLDSSISLDWRNNVFGKINSNVIDFLNKAERLSLQQLDTWQPADALAAAVMLWPELATKSIMTNVIPVIDGSARGSVLVDYANSTGKLMNVKIVRSFNTSVFQQLLLDKFSVI